MTESKSKSGPSLLPYLESTRGGIHIDIPAIRIPSQAQTSDSIPIESTGPFAMAYEGTISTGAEAGLANLFLLFQPDNYPPVSAELDPMTNVHVEQLWQTAFQRSSVQAAGTFQSALREQVDDQGRLLQLRPLFHCTHRNRWCHPLCPHCGEGLTLCCDDQLLKDAGLPEYTSSLDRFLYCPSCAAGQTDGAVFYARELPGTSTAHVQDCNQLMEGFSRLLAGKGAAEELPCVGCAESTNCYGPKTLVLDRMRALFFYPFHLLFMPSPSMNLIEFSALLSGQKREEILARLQQQAKPGRAGHLKQMGADFFSSENLLFREDERCFLEVLYLKLTLLEDLYALIPLEKGQISEPVGRMSLESIWVDLPVRSAHLPLFWNFSLRLIDPVGQPDRTMSGNMVPLRRKLHFLGAAWCNVLLTGGGQGMASIRAAVDKLIQYSDLIQQAEAAGLEEIDPVFNPQHLTAGANDVSIDPQWAAFWRRALMMGVEIVKAGFDADPKWSEGDFQHELGMLRKEIRQSLFKAAATALPAAKPVHADSDGAIAAILKSMLNSWPAADTAVEGKTSFSSKLLKEEVSSPASKNEDGDYVETVILGKEEVLEARTESTMQHPPDPMEMEETVVMRVADSAPKPETEKDNASLDATVVIQSDPARNGASNWTTDMEETVVISASPKKQTPDEALEKTVVLGAPKASERSGFGADSETPAQDASSDADDLEKTVIIQSTKTKGKTSKS